jgi:hypothetical protein
VWPFIRVEPQAEREIVRQDGALERNIRREVSPMNLLKTYLLLTFQKEEFFPAHFKAFLEATDIVGTHEARVYSILRGVSPGERAEMQTMPGLVETIKDEMSGRELQLALQLLYGRVEAQGASVTSVRTSTHLETGERYRLDLDVRQDFETVQRDLEEVVKSEDQDAILGDTSLWARFADEFDKEEFWYLRMITRYRGQDNFPKLTGSRSSERSFIFPIWESVKGMGTDEDKLLGTLTDVKTATGMVGGGGRALRIPPKEELKDEPSFIPMLQDELSGGDLRRALDAVSGTASVEIGIRSDLENAIDHHKMNRIRELLKASTLSASDRARLQMDQVILDEMGEELDGAQLCETSLLLKYGGAAFPAAAATLLEKFQRKPIDVAGAVLFLRSLAATPNGLSSLRAEPGIYFMLTNSGLPERNVIELLSAIRADEPGWQEPGSEGTHRHHSERVQARLPVSFSGSEVRIPIRCNIDLSKMKGKKELDSGTIEAWLRKIDEVWNGRFVLRNHGRAFNLVFSPYIAVGVTAADVTIFVMDWEGRSFVHSTFDPIAAVWLDREMNLFLEGLEPATVAHEFGHVLGNPDEYHLTSAEYSRIVGASGASPPPRGGETAKGLMGSQSESEEVHPRFAAPALEVVNAARDTATFPDPFTLERR